MKRASPQHQRRHARAIPLHSPWEIRGAESPFSLWFSTLIRLVDREVDRRTGFLWRPVAFGLGIILYFLAESEPAFWAAPTLAVLLALGVYAARGWLRASLIYALFLMLGFFCASLRTALVSAPMIDRLRIIEMSGFVETADSQPGRQRVLLRPVAIEGIASEALPFRVRIGIPGRNSVEPGQFVSFRARLLPPADPALPGGYDFRREAFFRSIGGVGFALGKIETKTAPHEAALGLKINAQIDRWRNQLTDRIARAIGEQAGALSAALITGKRGLLMEDTNDALRASGLYHIVSISGLHMVLAAGIFLWITRALLAAIPSIALHHPIKKYAAAVAMVGATFYCIFSGSDVATERSLIMTLVILGAILVDRPALAMRNLALSALIVLAREPESLLGPSFQMSYAAVAALITANRVYVNWKRGREPAERSVMGRMGVKILLAFAGIAATTLVATLATAPFAAYHFHRLNPLGLIGNSLAIPLVSMVVMPAAVAGTLLIPFGLDGFVWRIMGQGVEGVLMVAERVAALDHAVVAVPSTGTWPFALLILALLVFTCLQTRLRWAALPLLIASLVTMRALPLPDILTNQDGTMALIRSAEGYKLLAIGTGNRFTLMQWLPALGDSRAPNDPSLKTQIRCDSTGCIGRLADQRIVSLSLKSETLRDDCQTADILITPGAPLTICGADKRILGKTHFDHFGASLISTQTERDWQIKTTLYPDQPRPWRKTVSRATPAAPTKLEMPSPSDPTSDSGLIAVQ